METGPAPKGTSLILGIILNIAGGMMIGFIANCIVSAIAAAGDMINMQMGLSSCNGFGPNSRSSGVHSR